MSGVERLANTFEVAPRLAVGDEAVHDDRRVEQSAVRGNVKAVVFAQRQGVQASLKLPDCCVLLTAQQHDARIASFDSDLRAAARKLGLATAE